MTPQKTRPRSAVSDEHKSATELPMPTLVGDDVYAPASPCGEPQLLTHEEAAELERLERAAADARAADAVSRLTLSRVNLKRGHEVRVAFDQADDDAEVGGHLLQELVAGETAIALELQDVEAGLVSLLSKTIIDPTLAVAVTKTLREVVGVSSAIRRRMENSLGAAENLKAQRRFLSAQRGRFGV